MGLNDALAMPMADLFDPAQAQWTYRAEAADVLHSTQLPIPPDRFVASQSAGACPARSAGWWAAAMKGQDFSSEDRLDTARFNSALWQGLGSGPEPTTRDGKDLREHRAALLQQTEPVCASAQTSLISLKRSWR
jgi:hypothetical protein